MTLRIGTRRSPLALRQAEIVASALRDAHPGLEVVLHPMSTRGDRFLAAPLNEVGGKGLFVAEIEEALLRSDVDLAVHSLKDVPAEIAAELELVAWLPRVDPRDAFVSNRIGSLDALPPGARIGTSSLRRAAQLRARRGDLWIEPVRGNVQTRLGKLDDGLDAIVLAAAGLERLGLADRITQHLEPDVMLPAAGQGILGIEARAGDAATRALLAPLDHAATRIAALTERAFSARIGGSCQIPLAALATIAGARVHAAGLIGDPLGRRIVRHEVGGPAEDAVRLGTELADRVLADGGREILAALVAPFPEDLRLT